MLAHQIDSPIQYGVAEMYIEILHIDNDGMVTLAIKSDIDGFKQWHYTYDQLSNLERLGVIEVGKNYYISICSYYKPWRAPENVRQIRTLYADLDYHNYRPELIDSAIERLIDHLQYGLDDRLPVPSMIIHTGRGLQLYWLLEHLPKQGLPLWQVVQNTIVDALIEELKPFGVTVDPLTDITRLLRLPGTYNTKSETIARIVANNTKIFRLDEIIADYFPELQVVRKPNNKKRKKQYSQEEFKLKNFYNLHRLHFTRLRDLVKLLELRKGRINSDECRRRMVFLYRYWSCCFTGDPEKALEDTLEFNKMFTKPLSPKVVESNTRSAEQAYYKWLSGEMVMYAGKPQRMGYNYRNSTLIKWLGITPEEQREMETIIGTKEKYRRNNNRRSGKDESGLTAKQRERKERDQRILEMHKQGASYSEIGKACFVDKSTVCRVIQKALHF